MSSTVKEASKSYPESFTEWLEQNNDSLTEKEIEAFYQQVKLTEEELRCR